MEYKKLKNMGYRAYRLLDAGNEPEAKFARAWEALNTSGDEINDFLHQLFYDGNQADQPTEEDRSFAATLAQWLGSGIGWQFLTQAGRVKKSNSTDKTLLEIFQEEWFRKNRHSSGEGLNEFLMNMCEAAEEGLDGMPSGLRQDVTAHTRLCAEKFIDWLATKEGTAFFMGAQVTDDLKKFF